LAKPNYQFKKRQKELAKKELKSFRKTSQYDPFLHNRLGHIELSHGFQLHQTNGADLDF
jgi:hypothetical protein